MTTTKDAPIWTLPAERDTSLPPIDPIAFAAVESYTSLIALGAATSPRSLQLAIGSSEIGFDCDRRLAYKLAGTRPVHRSLDPMRSIIGIGVHLELAQIFDRLDNESGRFLIEQIVMYRSVPGQVDLYDRFNGMVVDWKTSTASRIRQYRREGLPRNYTTQIQMYGAGLTVLGETPKNTAIITLPIDDDLSKAWAWVTPYNQSIADAAVDRLNSLRGRDPAEVPNHPDRLCQYCDHFRPESKDLRIGCPGPSEKGNEQ